MPGRRDALRSALAVIGLSIAMMCAVSGPASAAAPSPEAATEFIRTTADRMIGIIDGTEDLTTKRDRLQAVVDGSVDTQQIARFCLGRYWRLAKPAQRQRFIRLFHRVLLEGVTGQISGYHGVRVDLGRATVLGGTTTVQSTVHRPGQADVDADWIVARTPAGLRIQDVVAEGVSMRLTRRSDYNSYLGRNGGRIETLLAAMQNRLNRS
jgi:phospholipid transport system substrate-binding protein